MSNDLISKSTLLNELKEKVYPEKFGERCNALDVIYAVLQVIKEQPTAYDVDKVVERLEDTRVKDTSIFLDREQELRCFAASEAYKKAMKIVKSYGD